MKAAANRMAADRIRDQKYTFRFWLQPLTGIVPGPDLRNSAGEVIPPAVIYLLLAVALLVVLLLAPMVPHISEEIWERMGGTGSVFERSWPTFDELAAAEDVVTIAVQINGKLRGEVEAERGADQDEVLELAMADERILRHLEGKTVRKVIHVPDRILNLVVG